MKKSIMIICSAAIVGGLVVGAMTFNQKVDEAAELTLVEESSSQGDLYTGESNQTTEEDISSQDADTNNNKTDRHQAGSGVSTGSGMNALEFTSTPMMINGRSNSYINSLFSTIIQDTYTSRDNYLPAGFTNINRPSTTAEASNSQRKPSNEQGSNQPNPGSPSSTNTSDESATNSGSAKPITDIRNKYTQEFQQLAFQFNWSVDSLVEKAEVDVFMNGMNNVDKNYYRSQAKALEAEADAAFNKKYAQMKQELGSNGHDESSLAEFKASYENQKASKMQELESKASGF